MAVIFTRIVTPVPGKRQEVINNFKQWAQVLKESYGVTSEIQIRVGAFGEVLLVARHDKIQEVEDIERKIVSDLQTGKLAHLPEGIFRDMRDSIWLVV